MQRKRIGIGVVGMGWMGPVHSRSYRQVADRFIEEGIDPDLVVCADADVGKAKEACSRFGFQRYTTDWHDLVNDPAVGTVESETGAVTNEDYVSAIGHKTLLSGPAQPYHQAFNPAWGLNLGNEDTRIIEAKEFLCSVRDNLQREPSLEAARQVAWCSR